MSLNLPYASLPSEDLTQSGLHGNPNGKSLSKWKRIQATKKGHTFMLKKSV